MKKQVGWAAVALVAATLWVANPASAQVYQDGYQFGAGVQAGYAPFYGGNARFGFRPFLGFPRFSAFTPRFEEPPYFAKFPPVHYSGVIPRPYGISPYAAPPGILPTEMMIKPEPKKITNPFFSEPVEEEIPPAAKPDEANGAAGQEITTRVTAIRNPWYGAVAKAR